MQKQKSAYKVTNIFIYLFYNEAHLTKPDKLSINIEICDSMTYSN